MEDKAMNILEIITIGIGLAMDSFAVSICKGLSIKKMSWKNVFLIALYFSIFHFGMPIIGYFLGETFSSFMGHIDHWVAFILLSFIGIKMIVGSFSKKKNKRIDSVRFKDMLALVIATSIDPLAIGVALAFLETNIIISASIIGAATFVLSAIGVIIGNRFGGKFDKKAEGAGGVILVLIGLKILLEHLGVLAL